MKMTVANQIKTFDKKNMQDKAQYHLDRKAAKISALSSKDLPKYEHLTGEDLGYEPSALEQARFEYSQLIKLLNKGLKEEGPLKILKIFEGKNKKQLKVFENQGNKQLNAIKNINIGSKEPKVINYFNKISPEAEKIDE